MISLESFIVSASLLFSITLIVIIFKDKEKHTSKYFMLAFYMCILSSILWYYGQVHNKTPLKVTSWVLTGPAGFLKGPIIFFYVKSLFLNKKVFNKKFILHFTPFLILYFVLALPIAFSMLSPVFKETAYMQFLYIIRPVYYILEYLFILIYLIAAFILLKRIIPVLKKSFSSLKETNIKWTVTWIVLFGILLIADVGISLLKSNLNEINLQIIFTIELLANLTFAIAFGWSFIKINIILIPSFIQESIEYPTHKSGIKSTETVPKGRNNEESIEIRDKLINEVKEKKLYINDKITLNQLSEKLEIPAKKLSDILNIQLKTNFFNFINKLRVEEFKNQCLKEENKHLSILGIAYNCGFNSKTAFYRAFKKVERISPNTFINNASGKSGTS